MALTSPKTTSTNSFYTKIAGTWTSLSICTDFTADGTGKLIYNGNSGVEFLFNGESNLSANVAERIYYALYKNGVLVLGAETPLDMTSSSKIGAIGITSYIELDKNDYLEVFVKSETSNSVISETLLITFLGEK